MVLVLLMQDQYLRKKNRNLRDFLLQRLTPRSAIHPWAGLTSHPSFDFPSVPWPSDRDFADYLPSCPSAPLFLRACLAAAHVVPSGSTESASCNRSAARAA